MKGRKTKKGGSVDDEGCSWGCWGRRVQIQRGFEWRLYLEWKLSMGQLFFIFQKEKKKMEIRVREKGRQVEKGRGTLGGCTVFTHVLACYLLQRLPLWQ
jgi:hypothetical protein